MAEEQWISVYEKLPQKNEKVCVADGVHMWDCGSYQGLANSNGDPTIWNWKHNTIKYVKWWMPKKGALPPVPENSTAPWISVDEKLPEIGKVVLCALYLVDFIAPKDGKPLSDAIRWTKEAAKHPHVELGYYYENGWNDYDGFPMICEPLYWMPIEYPAPPKIGGET